MRKGFLLVAAILFATDSSFAQETTDVPRRRWQRIPR